MSKRRTPGFFTIEIIALSCLKQSGGALINVGSEVSEAIVPLQGMYSATKRAVKDFTDALREGALYQASEKTLVAGQTHGIGGREAR